MRNLHRALWAVVCATALSLHAAPRTFVASTGLDANPCSRLLPCRTFAAALAVTDVDGEVVVLDSAGYGPFSVMQSVSVLSPTGVYAGVTATTGDGIVVNVAAPQRVILRGLSVTGTGSAVNGIDFVNTGTLEADDVVITNFANAGILSNGGGTLTVHHGTIRGRIGFATDGVDVIASSGTAYATVENTVIEDVNEGVFAIDHASVAVVDTRVSNSTNRAFRANNASVMNIERGTGVNSVEGLLAGCTGSPVVRVSNSTFTGNTQYGVRICAGAVFSRGNNTISGNATDVSGALSAIAAQ